MRLDQFVSQGLGVSRKQAKGLIIKKLILVNNQTKGIAEKVSNTDNVSYKGQIIHAAQELYYALHKPSGFCCSHEHDGYPSALTLLPDTPQKLHFAGRLDADTTGLVLLSSDGKWCHKVTSPKQKQQKAKRYQVHCSGILSSGDIEQLEQGITLRNENKPTLPAKVKLLAPKVYEVSISEGKYHQVRRMFAAVGNHVEQLHRVAIGNVMLDNTLTEGQYRKLSPEEVADFE